MIVRSRFRLALAAALAAHAWLAWELRPRPARDLASSNAAPMEAEIAIEAPAVEEPVASVEPATVTARPDAVARERAGSRPTSTATSVEPSPSSSSETPALAAPRETADDGSWTFSPTRGASGGAALPQGLARGGEVGVREAQAEEEKKAVAQAPPIHYTPQDFSLGLVPGGRFVGITRDDVRTSLVPDISRALLEFDTNREGIVITVRVLDVSSDRVSWDDVAAALRTELSTGRPERVPPGANGVAVVLEVISTLKTANGTAPTKGAFETLVRAINNPVDVALEGKQSAHREVAVRIVDVKAL